MKDIIDNKTIDKLNRINDDKNLSPENIIDKGDKKIEGAISEVSRRQELDETVENNLSTGLHDNPDFVADNKKINKKRNLYTAGFKSTLKLKKDIPDFKNTLKLKNSIVEKEVVPPFVLDDEYKQSMKELEEEMSDSFNKEVYNKMSEMNKVLLLDHLVDNPLNQEKSEIINIGFASEGNYNVVAFSDNGYLMQLANREEVATDKNIDIKSDKAQYNLISPEGLVLAEKINYEVALEGIEILASGYLQKLKEEFSKQETEKEPNLNTESEINSNTKETNKITNDEVENKTETVFVKPLNKKVAHYAESIGIKAEELAANKEFLALSPEQQQFALETLRRTSLAKSRVEAHESFNKEKASKKWWQVGFSFNQNYHKERHKIEAVKNIESRGLEGYGETELDWLVDVIKSGPEVKINNAGEIIIDCLHEENFDDSQKELIAKYNEEARKYIEKPKLKNTGNADEIAALGAIRLDLFDSCKNQEEVNLLISNLIEAEKNIQLLKFLSANKDTEKLLNKLSETSLTGSDKTKAMFNAHTDKMGYSTLGFAMRTGSKVALANSAYLAGALSYAAAPMVASIIGGFRSYNKATKELKEKEDLAQLGVEDKSSTAKALNVSTGTKTSELGNEIVFGLQDKLDNLIDKVEKLRRESNNEEEILKAEEALEARIFYTQGQINNNSVSYGKNEERGVNYFNLINSLSRAGVVSETNVNLLNNYRKYYYTGEQTKKLTRKELHGEKKLAELRGVSVEDRLASFLNYKQDKQNKKENWFLAKKVLTGAVIGGSFAAAGAFVAEHLNIASWFNGKSETGAKEGLSIIPKASASESALNIETPTIKVANHVESVPIIKAHIEPISRETIPLETLEPKPIVLETKLSDIHQEIVIKNLNTPVETLPLETPSHIENIPIENPETTIEVPVTPTYSSEQISQEVIDGRNAAVEVKNLINTDNQAARLAGGLYSNKPEFRTEEGFIKQISALNSSVKLSADEEIEAKNIYESFKQNNDYNILRRRLTSFENGLTNKNISSAAEVPVNTEAPTASIEAAPTASVSTSEAKEIIDGKNAAAAFKNSIDADNQAAKIAGGTYVNEHSISAVEAETSNNIINSESLGLKSENISESGKDLIYQKGSVGKIIFDTDKGIIKEAVDVKGEKIPKNFIDELVGKSKLDKFSRQGGLDKLLANWNKLGSNDKLAYNSLSWFEKGTMNSADLLKQIQGVYQVNTENVYVDAGSKHFMTGEGKNFDMNLKGIRKLVKFLARK